MERQHSAAAFILHALPFANVVSVSSVSGLVGQRLQRTRRRAGGSRPVANPQQNPARARPPIRTPSLPVVAVGTRNADAHTRWLVGPVGHFYSCSSATWGTLLDLDLECSMFTVAANDSPGMFTVAASGGLSSLDLTLTIARLVQLRAGCWRANSIF
jgi:hypothetical protein